jgi:hypothetical protein
MRSPLEVLTAFLFVFCAAATGFCLVFGLLWHDISLLAVASLDAGAVFLLWTTR